MPQFASGANFLERREVTALMVHAGEAIGLSSMRSAANNATT